MAPDPIHSGSGSGSGPGAGAGTGSARERAQRDGVSTSGDRGLERVDSIRSDRSRSDRIDRAAFPPLQSLAGRLTNGTHPHPHSHSHSRSASGSGAELRDGSARERESKERRRDRDRERDRERGGARSGREDDGTFSPSLSLSLGTVPGGAAGAGSGEMDDGEVITTIFVVGFPDDMAEREFQNLFTFAPGFEAATLKLPSSSLSASGTLPGSIAGSGGVATGAGGTASALRQQQAAGAAALLAELQALAAQQAQQTQQGADGNPDADGQTVHGEPDLSASSSATAARQAQLEEALAALQFSMAHPSHPSLSSLSSIPGIAGLSASSSSSTTPSGGLSLTPSVPSGPLSSLLPVTAPSASGPGAGGPNGPNGPGRRQAIGFARFRTREHALAAKEHLQGRRVDGASGNTLKAEIAKKNLHTKRPLASGSGVPAAALAAAAAAGLAGLSAVSTGTGAGTGAGAGEDGASGLGRRAMSLSLSGPAGGAGTSAPGTGGPNGTGTGLYPLSPTSAVPFGPGGGQAYGQPHGYSTLQHQPQYQHQHQYPQPPPHTQPQPNPQSAKEAWDSWSDTHLSPPPSHASLHPLALSQSQGNGGSSAASASASASSAGAGAGAGDGRDGRSAPPGAGGRSPNMLPLSTSTAAPGSAVSGTPTPGPGGHAGHAGPGSSTGPRSDAGASDSRALLALAEEEDEWPLSLSAGGGGAERNGAEYDGTPTSASAPTVPTGLPPRASFSRSSRGPTSPTLSHASASYGYAHASGQVQALGQSPPGPGAGAGYGPQGQGQAGSPPGSEVLSDYPGQSHLPPGAGGGGGGGPRYSVSSAAGVAGGGMLGVAAQPVGSGNPADQNPPINTLYVGNLPAISPPTHPPNFLEESLRSLFARAPGFKRMSFRQKINGPMCFVEFEDVAFATEAMRGLYGHNLGGLVKGGIRLSYSKNSLGQRGASHANAAHPSLYGGLAHTVALAGMTSASAVPGGAAPPNPNPNLNLVGGMYHQVHPNAVRDPGTHYPASDRRPEGSLVLSPGSTGSGSGPGPGPGSGLERMAGGLSPNAAPFASSLSPRQRSMPMPGHGSGPMTIGSLSPGSGHGSLGGAGGAGDRGDHADYPQSLSPSSHHAGLPLSPASPTSPTSPIRTPASYAWVSAGQGLGNGYGGYGGFGGDVGRNEASLSGAAAAWGAERGG